MTRRDQTRHVGLIRTLKMIELLRQGRRFSAAELARRFEVTPRTVWRDIDVMVEAGLRVRRTLHKPGMTTLFWIARRVKGK